MEDLLRKLSLEEFIPKFAEKKMTLFAIQNATEGELESLGMTALGDRLSLIGAAKMMPINDFARNNPIERSRALLERDKLYDLPRNAVQNRRNRTRSMPKAAAPAEFSRKVKCVSSCTSIKKVRSMSEIVKLFNCGLWDKTVTCEMNRDVEQLREAVYKVFEPLRACGGFEFLKNGTKPSEMEIITIPDSGYSAVLLTDLVPFGQLYVRPLQRDIILTAGALAVPHLETCLECNLVMPASSIRKHRLTCLGRRKPGNPIFNTEDNIDADNDDDFEIPSFTVAGNRSILPGPTSVGRQLDSNGNARSMRLMAMTQSSPVPSLVSPLSSPALPSSFSNLSSTQTSPRLPAPKVVRSAPYTVPRANNPPVFNMFRSMNRRSNDLSPSTSPLQAVPQLQMVAQKLDVVDVVDPHIEEENASIREAHENTIAELSEQQMDWHEENCEFVDEDEDVFLQAALAVSSDGEPDSCKVVKAMAKACIVGGTNHTILVRRTHMWLTAMSAFLDSSFDFKHQFTVEFSGELGSDFGGPKREFLRLVMKDMVVHSGIFIGDPDDGNVTLSHNVAMHSAGMYALAGKVVAASVVHGGPGLRCMHDIMYAFLVNKKVSNEQMLRARALPSTQLQLVIDKLKACTSTLEFREVVTIDGDFICDHGFSDIYTATFSAMPTIVSCMIEDFLHFRIQAEMTQFCDGMNCVYDRFSELMKLHPKLLSPIFTSSMKAMGRQDLNKLFLFVRSDPYSNDWQREEDTVYGFQKLLIDIENKKRDITYEHILKFATGADCVPPLGFDDLIQIKFYTSERNERRYPFSSTCDMIMWLPSGVVDLGDILVEAIKCSPTFDKV